ncbi:hypothetical protein HCN44_003320, partial [Aphidius gifuensis]
PTLKKLIKKSTKKLIESLTVTDDTYKLNVASVKRHFVMKQLSLKILPSGFQFNFYSFYIFFCSFIAREPGPVNQACPRLVPVVTSYLGKTINKLKKKKKPENKYSFASFKLKKNKLFFNLIYNLSTIIYAWLIEPGPVNQACPRLVPVVTSYLGKTINNVPGSDRNCESGDWTVFQEKDSIINTYSNKLVITNKKVNIFQYNAFENISSSSATIETLQLNLAAD